MWGWWHTIFTSNPVPLSNIDTWAPVANTVGLIILVVFQYFFRKDVNRTRREVTRDIYDTKNIVGANRRHYDKAQELQVIEQERKHPPEAPPIE